MKTKDRWYENATFYAIDMEAFADGNGDGIGDFAGLTDRLDYLEGLGVDCLWLLPFYLSPNRDNGYDVADYYGVDDRHGTLGEFVEFVREADRRGIRVIVDLVVNHTSDQHPWFQQARSDPDSEYRDYYVWREDPPDDPDPHRGPVFPGEEDAVWSYDEEAEAFYYHRFYHFQPDLNTANPDVREEIRKIMGFWLQLGVSGFRVDAATLMIDNKGGLESTKLEDPHGVLKDMRHFVERRGDEMNVLLNFLLDAYLVLALAEQEAEPIRKVLDLLPDPPAECQWANFLRNYDELNVGRLPPEDQQNVFEAFAPDEEMRIYGRGIRRRLASMLEGDRDRIELAYSLLFSLPGTPLLIYGDEIGMGDDLSLPGRGAGSDPDAVGRRAQRRVLERRPPVTRAPGDLRRGVRLRVGQRRRPARRPRLPAPVVLAAQPPPGRVPRNRPRRVRDPRHRRPRSLRPPDDQRPRVGRGGPQPRRGAGRSHRRTDSSAKRALRRYRVRESGRSRGRRQ
jgi:maltose alpha-D-glucosyltransferase/alpha-amylase